MTGVTKNKGGKILSNNLRRMAKSLIRPILNFNRNNRRDLTQKSLQTAGDFLLQILQRTKASLSPKKGKIQTKERTEEEITKIRIR